MNTRADDTVDRAPKRVDADEMDWDAYAEHYDEMCALNPAYDENIAMLMGRVPLWDLPPNAGVCDLGAGTGNYILSLNQIMPDAQYWHVDFDQRMVELAIRKYRERGLRNVKIVRQEVHNVSFPAESFDLIICINALYAFAPQKNVLEKMREWLRPGGKVFLIDFGRRQKTLDWMLYMFRESVKSRKTGRYVRALVEARELMKQNRRTMKGQASGRYWLHSTEEFGASLEEAGFVVQELTGCYRGYADLAVCSKGKPPNSP